MKTKIEGKNIFISILSPDNYSPNYTDWLMDQDINKYLESRWRSFKKEDIVEYIKQCDSDKSIFLFGIFLRKTGQHIGNIKIAGIHSIYRYAHIGYLIGEKEQWGKGLAAEAVSLILLFARNELKLNKVIAGVYKENQASIRVLERNGFNRAALFKKHVLLDGEYHDTMVYEKIFP